MYKMSAYTLFWIWHFTSIFLLLICAKGEATDNIGNLKSLNGTLLKPITVSGFSSGGAMATQFHVAHSSIVSSVGAFASTFYRCGPGGHPKYRLTCIKNLTLVSSSVKDAEEYEKLGKIDPLSNLNGSNVFVWSGTLDQAVPTAVTLKVGEFYKRFAPSYIRIVTQLARHNFPTDDFGPKCPKPALRFIGNCNFSGVFEMMSTFYGSSVQKPPGNLKTQPLIYFNQSEFTEPSTPNSIGLDDVGYYYIPTKCQAQGQDIDGVKCPLHIFFHGCSLGAQDFQVVFVDKIGLLKLAEQNNIVILFPRATRVPVINPMGCWDVYGAHGDNYATKEAVQITAVRKMVGRLFGEI